MREDLKSATEAMKAFRQWRFRQRSRSRIALKAGGPAPDHLSGSDNLNQIRTGIKEVSAAILESHEQLDRTNRLVISQLRDEIRTLHNAMGAERQRRLTDQTSGVWNRQAIKERMDILLASRQPFCVLVVGIGNWKRIQVPVFPNHPRSRAAGFPRRAPEIPGRGPDPWPVE